jgi:glycosidase
MLLAFTLLGCGAADESSADLSAARDGAIPLSDATQATTDALGGRTDAQGGGPSEAGPTEPDGAATPEPTDARPTPTGDATPGRPDAGVGADARPAAPITFRATETRSCSVTLRAQLPGAARAQVAGEFTGWGDAPLDMVADGGGAFSLALGPEAGLEPGRTYAYKLIVDGEWRLDPGQTRQKFDGNCVNSAFEVPACADAPEVEVTAVGARTFEAIPRAAAGGSPELTLLFTLDGFPWSPVCELGTCTAELSDLAPGRHVVTAQAVDADGRTSSPVSVPFWIEPAGTPPFEWRDATLYMLMIDRFANGDRTNDAPVRGATPYPNDWHGGDLQGALRVLESGYFERKGVNAIWLSPVNEQAESAFPGRDVAQTFTGYHGYWPVRGRAVEPRFGGDEALRAFVDAAHRRGIRVLLDLINNQIHQDHEYYRDHPEWFRTGCVCGTDPGCGWSERPLDCLFAPYLPDINWRVPGAERQFIDDALYWIEAYGVDGFRVDAVKHVETNAIYNLRAAMDARFGGAVPGAARLVMLGETAVGEGDRFDDGCGVRYGDGYEWISAYAGRNALDGQFDFPTHHRMQWGLLTDGLGYDALEGIVRDLERRYPADATHVRFLGSHDSNRMATRAARDPAGDCRSMGGAPCDVLPGVPRDAAVYARLKRAFTVLYTLPGIPLLYAGDEVAMPGGNDPDNRRDMLFDADLSDVAMSVLVPTAEQRDLGVFMERLGQARAALPALRRGRRTALVAEPELSVVEYRTDDGARALVVVNRGGAVVNRVLDAAPDVATVARLGEATVTVDGGSVRLSVPAGGVGLFGDR